MADIIIYSKDHCPYCVKAKNLLKQKGQSFEEIDISKDQEKFQEMLEKSGNAKTVPQIFIGDTHVGGFDDLHALDKSGKLEALLAS